VKVERPQRHGVRLPSHNVDVRDLHVVSPVGGGVVFGTQRSDGTSLGSYERLWVDGAYEFSAAMTPEMAVHAGAEILTTTEYPPLIALRDEWAGERLTLGTPGRESLPNVDVKYFGVGDTYIEGPFELVDGQTFGVEGQIRIVASESGDRVGALSASGVELRRQGRHWDGVFVEAGTLDLVDTHLDGAAVELGVGASAGAVTLSGVTTKSDTFRVYASYPVFARAQELLDQVDAAVVEKYTGGPVDGAPTGPEGWVDIPATPQPWALYGGFEGPLSGKMDVHAGATFRLLKNSFLLFEEGRIDGDRAQGRPVTVYGEETFGKRTAIASTGQVSIVGVDLLTGASTAALDLVGPGGEVRDTHIRSGSARIQVVGPKSEAIGWVIDGLVVDVVGFPGFAIGFDSEDPTNDVFIRDLVLSGDSNATSPVRQHGALPRRWDRPFWREQAADLPDGRRGDVERAFGGVSALSARPGAHFV